MYNEFYGLEMNPFSLNPDHLFFYAGGIYGTARNILEYALLRKEGIVVITGEAGCGKTALIQHFLSLSPSNNDIGIISNPGVLRSIPILGIMNAFEQQVNFTNEALLYAKFQDFLNNQYEAGRSTILIVDEAQNLSQQSLEELRMFSNPSQNGAGALQLVLVGHSQLKQMLCVQELRQLIQRVTTHYHLHALGQSETFKYVLYRLKIAQCQKAIFSSAALSRIYVGSRGIPRMINRVCDTSLVYGYAEGMQKIDEDLVEQVITDLGLKSTSSEIFPSNSNPQDSPRLQIDSKTVKLLYKNSSTG